MDLTEPGLSNETKLPVGDISLPRFSILQSSRDYAPFIDGKSSCILCLYTIEASVDYFDKSTGLHSYWRACISQNEVDIGRRLTTTDKKGRRKTTSHEYRQPIQAEVRHFYSCEIWRKFRTIQRNNGTNLSRPGGITAIIMSYIC